MNFESIVLGCGMAAAADGNTALFFWICRGASGRTQLMKSASRRDILKSQRWAVIQSVPGPDSNA